MKPDAVRKRKQRRKERQHSHLALWWPTFAHEELHDLMDLTGLDEVEALAWAVNVGRRMASARGPILIEPPKNYVPRDIKDILAMSSSKDEEALEAWVDEQDENDD
tara:strand:+ start:6552 stop:6869 length:318 start_codon:yes stop_codon:yes gene_type:complete